MGSNLYSAHRVCTVTNILKGSVVIMSSIFSIGGANNGAYNMFFADSSNAKSKSSSVSFLFGETSTLLGDYSMIKSGGYKKLLNAYYATQKTDDKSDGASVDSTSNLLDVKTNSVKLKQSLSKLSDVSLYEKKTDKDGKSDYDREAITGAVKNFVDAYNSYVDSSAKLDSTAILSRSLSIVKNTNANSTLLSKSGINIGKDNKLSLDEDALKQADVNVLKTLFTGIGSLSDTISSKASESYGLANSAVFTQNHAATYTYNAAYARFANSDNWFNGLM